MKYSLLILISILSSFSFAQDKELSIAQKIANAHGFKYWDKVSSIKFTFRVDTHDTKGKGRAWVWKPKTGDVTVTFNGETHHYNQKNISAENQDYDRAFINDKFWLLIPFQLVWDNTATISELTEKEAPISKTKMKSITITYPSEGGYTPGDAYDIYFNDNYLIKEWSYRKGNSAEASLSNTFENYQDFNGIKIAIDHKKDKGNWNLNFSNLEVITD